MVTATVADAKNNLSALIAQLESGQEDVVRICRRHKPVAEIRRIEPARRSAFIGSMRGRVTADDYDPSEQDEEIAALFGIEQ